MFRAEHVAPVSHGYAESVSPCPCPCRHHASPLLPPVHEPVVAFLITPASAARVPSRRSGFDVPACIATSLCALAVDRIAGRVGRPDCLAIGQDDMGRETTTSR